MDEHGDAEGRGGRRLVYCLVPRDLAGRLHEPLREHFAGDPAVEVIVERRTGERRSGVERREGDGERASGGERRRVRDPEGRRAGERRAAVSAAEPLPLPRRARRYADRLTFVERLEPAGERDEDLDTARLVARIQAGDGGDAFARLYTRYFGRVYSYFRVVLKEPSDAEDAAQQVFANALEALPRYERRSQPFRAWLFRIARNCAFDELKRRGRLTLLDPETIQREREREQGEGSEPEPHLDVLDWISDPDLVIFVERLPTAQRQVLALRYMLGLTTAEVAEVLDRTTSDVRVLQSRAIRFLRARLTAIGREPTERGPAGTRRRFRQAPVLRSRRFALGAGPPASSKRW